MIHAVRGLLVFIVLLALLLAVAFAWWRTSLPAWRGTIEMSGVGRTVEVTRRPSGLPTVRAQSLEDAYFTLGFLHAQDRLWQLEYERLEAAGRLAELLGERAFDSDRRARTLGFARRATEAVEELSPRALGLIQAYCDGVNALLDRGSGAPPPELLLLGHLPERWRPADVLTRWNAYIWERSSGLARELLAARSLTELGVSGFERLWPGQRLLVPAGTGAMFLTAGASSTEQRPPIPEGTLANSGSRLRELYRSLPLARLQGPWLRPGGRDRAWLVSAESSAVGRGLLAVETTGPLEVPVASYPVRISAPGLELSGASIPGVPIFPSGSNDALAWSLLATGVDSADLYLERVAGGRYLTADGWRELRVERETISVRGGGDREVTISATHRGPLLIEGSETQGAQLLALSLHWPIPDANDFQEALYLPFARRGEALAGSLVPPGNTLVAVGEMGLLSTRRSPERGAGDGLLPLPGWWPAADWVSGGMPESGEISDTSSGSGTAVHFAAGLPLDDSNERNEDLPGLDDLGWHSAESLERLLALELDPRVERLAPYLRRLRPVSALAREAHSYLLTWNGSLRAPSPAPLLFDSWYSNLGDLLFADELGWLREGERRLLREVAVSEGLIAGRLQMGELCSVEAPAAVLEMGGTDQREISRACAEVIAAAFERAVAELQDELGPAVDGWRVPPGQPYLHTVYRAGPLAPLFRIGSGAIGRNRPMMTDLQARETEVGDVYLAVHEVAGSWRYALPGGQSGNPLSTNYRDFAARWSQGRLYSPSGEEPVSLLTLEPRR